MNDQPELIAKTLRYKVATTRGGYRQVDQCLLLMGQLYNATIQHREAATGLHRKAWSIKIQTAHITDLHRNQPEFNPYARRLLESTVKRANTAYSRFFNLPGTGHPRTKSPYRFNTLEISEPANRHLKFSKDGKSAFVHIKGLPRLRLKTDGRLPLDQQPRVILITRTPRRLNACLVFNTEKPPYIEPPNQSVGIDPGVRNMLTAVDEKGRVLRIPGINDSQHRKAKKRMQRKAQRQRDAALRDGRARFVSQKNNNGTVKRRFRWTDGPSKSYLRNQAMLRRVEQKRQDALSGLQHRITTQLVRDHQVICIEDTKIKEITRSAKGTAEQPGSNVRLKASFNRAILAQNWGRIRSQLEYKCPWQDRDLVPVPSQNTSLTCHQCGSIDPKNRRSQSRFICRECGFEAHADDNAGENIRRQGLDLLARAENS